MDLTMRAAGHKVKECVGIGTKATQSDTGRHRRGATGVSVPVGSPALRHRRKPPAVRRRASGGRR
jgi:hypothetical protein